MKDQYRFLWNWLLDKGVIVATIIVNFFMAIMFAISMALLNLFLKYWDRFH